MVNSSPGAAGDRPRVVKRRGANLPHWRLEGATYAVTFRLADSMPASVLRRWRLEREEIVGRARLMGRPLSPIELARLEELHHERVEFWLDQGHGLCAMRDSRIACLVVDALRFFDGERYELLAWCVMPNHVHVVVRPLAEWELSNILLSWKSFTGRQAREILGAEGHGVFWQKESYDHIVRDRDDLREQIRYILNNPAKAGLRDWPWVWAATRRSEDSRTA